MERSNRRTGISVILSAILCLVMLQQVAIITSAQISESFELGFGDWVGDFNYDPAYFDVSISSLYAYDGSFSVKLQAHGLPSPKMTVWIERTVTAPPSTWMNVGITFQLYSESPLSTPKEVVAYAGNADPEDYADFTVIGQTDQVAGWYEYSHSKLFLSDPTGQIYVALGFYNHIVGLNSYYVDLVNLTGVSDDFTPPTISNLRPADLSTVGEKRPLIGADYGDGSGIDLSSVLLEVDSVDVTSSATVTASGVTYTPVLTLTEGNHDVYLEVRDGSANHNLAIAAWSFTVDTTAPAISGLLPANESAVGDTSPTIEASYSDASGIDTASVVLKVDSVDVTSSATVTSSGVSYTASLAEGPHDVYLEVKDYSTPQNVGRVSWWFLVDTSPPAITDLQPMNESVIGVMQPTISASYSDASEIDTSSVILRVDMVDVTSFATVTPSGVTYMPPTPLLEGSHNVYLAAKDNSAPQNTGWEMWFFTVDTTAPTISNLQPADGLVISDTQPTIGASYSDSSGIDVSSVRLRVNGVDMTAEATVTANDVSYVPSFVLWDGSHTVYLEVSDNSAPQNRATKAWSFTVDSAPPLVMNLQPANGSAIGDSMPPIGASYTDDSGIDMSAVTLELDTIDVTSSATVGPNQITYTPPSVLSEGNHDVYLEVKDQATPQNIAKAKWSFTVDTLPPEITNLHPANESTIGDSAPAIGASFSDPSGIDISSVIMKVNSVSVTGVATITSEGIAYTPAIPLFEGVHNVYLEASDNSVPQNTAVVMWWFSIDIDTQPPAITDLQPEDQSIIADNMPVIGASYGDDSGIDVNSVVLRVDSVDVTSLATVTSTTITYVPMSALSDGVHNVYLSVADIHAKVSTASWGFTIDATSPTTSLSILGPEYVDLIERTYVSSSTSFSLTAEDGGVGVEEIHYMVLASGQPEPGYSLHTSEFTIPSSMSDGLIYIKYKSVDELGNEESAAIEDIYLDNSPPTSAVPGYDSLNVSYISNSLQTIAVTAADGGSGVGSTCFGVDDPNCASTYIGPLVSGSMSEGEHTIYFRSIDNVGNEEAVSSITIFLDMTAPVADAGEDVQIRKGDTVVFDGSESHDSGGSGISEYKWTFTYRGSVVTLQGETPQFTLEDKDVYIVTLTVTDRAGNEDTDTMTITFAPQKDVSEFPLWVIALLIIIIILSLLVFLLWRKRRDETEETDEE